jgi:hypothetical protein
MNMKLWWGLVARFDKLCEEDEKLDIFFNERPWMLNPTETVKVITPSGTAKWETHSTPHIKVVLAPEVYSAHKQIILEMEKVCDKIHKMVEPNAPVDDKVIEDLFGVVPS